MILVYAGVLMLLLGVFVFFKKSEGQTEISVLGIQMKTTNSAIALFLLGGAFIYLGQNKSGIMHLSDQGTAFENASTKNEANDRSNSTSTKQPETQQGGRNNPDTPVENPASAFGKYPEGSERLLTEDDVRDKSAFDLKVMRNEIFARHGYIFHTKQMKDYFTMQSWYKGLYDNVDDLLTAVEKQNVNFIKSHEQ